METQTVNNNIKSFGLINANTLRLIACILMLMDHGRQSSPAATGLHMRAEWLSLYLLFK